jgi:hypothetical protein
VHLDQEVQAMAVRPKEDVEVVQKTVRIARPTVELAEKYARYLGGKSDFSHVLGECAMEVMSRDKKFQTWLKTQAADNSEASSAEDAPPRPILAEAVNSR